MATAFEIAGPVKVMFQERTGGSYVELGRTPNDDRVRLEITIHNEIVGSDETGDEPGDVVHTGIEGLLTMTLAKWDASVLEQLWDVLPKASSMTANQWIRGDIGRTWSNAQSDLDADTGFFMIQLLPAISGRVSRSFTRCYLDGPNAIQIFEMGNTGTMVGLSINVLPDSSTSLLFTEGTAA